MDPMREAIMQLAISVSRLAGAIQRYCDQQERQAPREAKPAQVSTAIYDRKQTQVEREMHDRFTAKPGPQAVPEPPKRT